MLYEIYFLYIINIEFLIYNRIYKKFKKDFHVLYFDNIEQRQPPKS